MTTNIKTTYEVQIEDVEYLRHGDKPFLARLFKPQGSGPFPVMVELHGGAWVNGNREDGNVSNEALASNGVIVAALDFRVPPEAPYPASFADIHYGIRWCKAHAEGWNGISDKIGAMGTSSGAHQAMLLGMRPHDSRYAALSLTNGAIEVDGTLDCVIMVSPVIDPLGRYHYAKGLRDDVRSPRVSWRAYCGHARLVLGDGRGNGRRCSSTSSGPWGAHETAAHAVPGTGLRGSAPAPGPRRVHHAVPQGWRAD